MKHISRVYIFVFSLLLLTASVSIAQEKIRTVEHGKYKYQNEPIEVVSRELGNKPFINDTEVLGDQDWLKQLTLGIKNVSNKNIMSFDIDLVIEKQGKMPGTVGMPIFFRTLTKTTADNVETPLGKKKQGVLQPGEVVKVKVRDHDLFLFGNELKKYRAEDFDRVMIDIRFVYFDDGTRWVLGQEGPYDKDKLVRPAKPKSTLNQRFSEWLKYFAPIDARGSSINPFAFIFPAGSRFFLRLLKPGLLRPRLAAFGLSKMS